MTTLGQKRTSVDVRFWPLVVTSGGRFRPKADVARIAILFYRTR